MPRILLAAFAIVLLAVPASAQTRLGTEGAYPPFNYVDDNGKVGGFDIEVGNEICRRAVLDCVWVVNEWDSIVPNLLAGNYDAILADLTITDERKQTIDFTQPYFPPDPSTYLSLATSKIDYTDMKGLRIGVQTGTVQAAWLDIILAKDNTIIKYEVVDQELADLNAGNLDVVMAESSFIAETVSGSSGTYKADGPPVPIGTGAGIGLRKADDSLRKMFDDALTAMKADGTLDRLILKFFPERGTGPFF
ncbi:MAG TPA: transporter substrate-binding domain-containing protein [Devosia sp.]|nr:transporter substrate-binding domain-containing protein [Devosia sp.]